VEPTNKINKADLPLNPLWKIISFMLPLFPIIISPYAFSPKEYKRRFEETWLWIVIGIVFWTLMAFIYMGFKSVSG
jgi:hypothetical protein